MTNNDKAFQDARDLLCDYLAKDKDVKIDYDYHPVVVAFDKALTPQSSADLGRVLKVVDNCLRNSPLDSERRICLMESIRNGIDNMMKAGE